MKEETPDTDKAVEVFYAGYRGIVVPEKLTVPDPDRNSYLSYIMTRDMQGQYLQMFKDHKEVVELDPRGICNPFARHRLPVSFWAARCEPCKYLGETELEFFTHQHIMALVHRKMPIDSPWSLNQCNYIIHKLPEIPNNTDLRKWIPEEYKFILYGPSRQVDSGNMVFRLMQYPLDPARLDFFDNLFAHMLIWTKLGFIH
jgi:hypothetical protein